jgi:alpha-D-ribose 1-methylphosphonate 5-triphosphate synthase subunit PhnL
MLVLTRSYSGASVVVNGGGSRQRVEVSKCLVLDYVVYVLECVGE